MWSFETKCFSGSVIQAIHDVFQFLLCDVVESF